MSWPPAARVEAERLLRAMESFADQSGLLPEQVWDTQDIPEHGLYFGRPSGSAMPLVWAHAEYVKLQRSLHDGRVFDMPPQPVERYLVQQKESPHAVWRFEQKRRAIRAGQRCDWKQWPPQPFVGPVMIGRASRRLNLTTRGWVFT